MSAPRLRVPAALKADLDRIVEAILYLVTESRRLSREVCARHGVTATQLSVIKLLDEIGDLSLSNLSNEMRARNSTVSGIADRMERDRLIERVQSAEDRRVWLVRLTERGRRLARSIEIAPWEVLRRAVETLSERDQAHLMALLRKVAGQVERTLGQTRTPGQRRANGTGAASGGRQDDTSAFSDETEGSAAGEERGRPEHGVSTSTAEPPRVSAPSARVPAGRAGAGRTRRVDEREQRSTRRAAPAKPGAAVAPAGRQPAVQQAPKNARKR